MKKTVSVLLAVMLIAVMLVIPASADTESIADVDILIGFTTKPGGTAGAVMEPAKTQAEIQEVIDEASTGAVILFNSGTYDMTFTVPASKSISLWGMNWNKAAEASGRAEETVVTGGISTVGGSGTSTAIKGFTFSGTGVSVAAGAAATVENNRFEYITSNGSTAAALWIDGGSAGSVVVKNNYFRNISGSERSAVLIKNPHTLTVDGNAIQQVDGSGIKVETTGLWSSNAGVVKVVNNTITDWDSNNNGGRAIDIDFTGSGSTKTTSAMKLSGNCFVRAISTAAHTQDFVSVKGVRDVTLDITGNYWNAEKPVMDNIFSTDTREDYSIYPHYKTEDMDELYAPAVNITNTNSLKYYATIQAAINDAAVGDKLQIASGTYDEELTISRPLRLYGPNKDVSPNSSDWSPASRSKEAVFNGGINLDNYTSSSSSATIPLEINGFTFYGSGITYNTPASSTATINNIVISNNIFTGLDETGAIIFANNASHIIKNFTAENNRIDGVTGGGAIALDYTSGTGSISGNYIRNVAGSAFSFAGQLSGTMTVERNRVENWSDSSAAVSAGTVAASSTLKLEYNVFKYSGTVPIQHGHYYISTKSSSASVSINRNYWGGGAPVVGKGSASVSCTTYYIDELLRDNNGFKVTIPTGAGYTVGLVSGYTDTGIEYGGSFKFILTLGPSYGTSEPVVKRGNTILAPDSKGVYTISNITSDVKDLTVSGIEADKVKVLFDKPEHGSIVVNKTATTIVGSGYSVESGTKLTLNVTADEGYVLKTLTVNGSSAVNGGTYTASGSEFKVAATFELGTTYRVSIVCGVGGTLSEQSKDVPEGKDFIVKITPSSGYETASVRVDGDDIGAVGTYTFSKVKANHTLYVTFKAAAAVSVDNFTDVPADAWYHTQLKNIIDLKLFKGISSTEFAPTSTMTRAMFVTVLWRLEGSPAPYEAYTFEDVDSGTWYSHAVAWAAANKIVNGRSATEFAPNDEITREQIALVLYNYAKYKEADVSASAALTSFSDSDKVSSWALDAVKWAVAEGLLKGRDNGTLDPLSSAQRLEVAVVFDRYIEKIG